jgi:hypothetical protein
MVQARLHALTCLVKANRQLECWDAVVQFDK